MKLCFITCHESLNLTTNLAQSLPTFSLSLPLFFLPSLLSFSPSFLPSLSPYCMCGYLSVLFFFLKNLEFII